MWQPVLGEFVIHDREKIFGECDKGMLVILICLCYVWQKTNAFSWIMKEIKMRKTEE